MFDFFVGAVVSRDQVVDDAKCSDEFALAGWPIAGEESFHDVNHRFVDGEYNVDFGCERFHDIADVLEVVFDI